MRAMHNVLCAHLQCHQIKAVASSPNAEAKGKATGLSEGVKCKQ